MLKLILWALVIVAIVWTLAGGAIIFDIVNR